VLAQSDEASNSRHLPSGVTDVLPPPDSDHRVWGSQGRGAPVDTTQWLAFCCSESQFDATIDREGPGRRYVRESEKVLAYGEFIGAVLGRGPAGCCLVRCTATMGAARGRETCSCYPRLREIHPACPISLRTDRGTVAPLRSKAVSPRGGATLGSDTHTQRKLLIA